jgi:bacillithiol system protein YtxJ
MNWIKLTNINQLEEIKNQSQTKAVGIFKHSTRCSISATALDRFERKGSKDPSPDILFYYLDLIAHRDISNKIASEYGVQHESPQFILVKNGAAVFDASHYEINYDEIIAKV